MMFLLYCRGHRLGTILAAFLIIAGILATQGAAEIPVPWLESLKAIDVATLCSVGYAMLILLFARNEISRLEAFTPARWIAADIAGLLTMWAVAWELTLLDGVGVGFAYSATVATALVVLGGTFLRAETIVLLLIAQFIAQTATWGSLRYTRWRLLLFHMEFPGPSTAALISTVALCVSAACLVGFKRHSE